MSAIDELLGSLYESAREKSKEEWMANAKAKLSSQPAAIVTGNDLVIGHETRGLNWVKGVNPYQYRPGTELYAVKS